MEYINDFHKEWIKRTRKSIEEWKKHPPTREEVLEQQKRLDHPMGRMHSDAQFAGSSSVPAHVEMMGFLGIGNNPMVGCTVACAVDVATALSK